MCFPSTHFIQSAFILIWPDIFMVCFNFNLVNIILIFRCPTSANRSLPDLPVDVSHLRHPDGSVIWESQEVGGDTGSELYATVEENARPGKDFWHSTRYADNFKKF